VVCLAYNFSHYAAAWRCTLIAGGQLEPRQIKILYVYWKWALLISGALHQQIGQIIDTREAAAVGGGLPRDAAVINLLISWLGGYFLPLLTFY
jgi:hypothetical protein